MTHQLTDISTVKKRLDIEIPQEVVDEEIDKIARNIGKRASVPGFRPGRAPLGVIKNRFKDDILTETCQHLLPRYFEDAAREEALEIVDAPTYDDLDHGRDRPLRFSATFEVFPKLDVTNHDGIPVEDVPTEVTDEEVDATIERLVEERSEMTPVEEDRPVESGDFVEITFTGSLLDENGAEIEGEDALTGERALCEIGGETTIAEFTENLTGARAGEDRTFEVHYSDDHPEKRLAGKTARYAVHVEALKKKTRPAVDDEFAGSLGKHETVGDLRKSIRTDLENHKEEHARQTRRDALLNWLQEHNDFEVPEVLVEHQVRTRIERLVNDLYRQGINPKGLDVDWSKIRNDQYDNAVRDVKGSLILSHLADREAVEASDEEVDQEIARVAEQMQQAPERVREVLGQDGGLERIRSQIRNNKVMELLEQRSRTVEPGSLSETGTGALAEDAAAE